jgi:hypothetical protein
MNSRERFTRSKCDRCGKATSGNIHEEGDLFTLPHEWQKPLSDQGDFCGKCVERYDEANWLVWFRERREQHENEIEALVDELEKALTGIPDYAVAYQTVDDYVVERVRQERERCAKMAEASVFGLHPGLAARMRRSD